MGLHHLGLASDRHFSSHSPVSSPYIISLSEDVTEGVTKSLIKESIYCLPLIHHLVVEGCQAGISLSVCYKKSPTLERAVPAGTCAIEPIHPLMYCIKYYYIGLVYIWKSQTCPEHKL